MELTRTTKRHMSIDSITQLIYSCVDLILHLFIVCIYWAAYHLLCACIVWPTVLLRWLGRCCWHFFFCVVFIAIVRRAKQKGREILWLVSWTTVPFLPNRMCFSKKKSILCSQCIHTVFWLFACVSQNQCTVKRESQRVVILLLKSHTA